MKEKIIAEVLNEMTTMFNVTQMEELQKVLIFCLRNVDIVERQKDELVRPEENNILLNTFLSAKRIEGCSEKSLKYYDTTIRQVINVIRKPIREIVTDDLRSYLADYQKERTSSKVTIDNMRRIFSSFFGWLEDEDYILKSPVRRIKKIKTEKTIMENEWIILM